MFMAFGFAEVLGCQTNDTEFKVLLLCKPCAIQVVNSSFEAMKKASTPEVPRL